METINTGSRGIVCNGGPGSGPQPGGAKAESEMAYQAALDATKKANETGQAEHHVEAATMHDEASKKAMKAGNQIAAASLSKSALRHSDMAAEAKKSAKAQSRGYTGRLSKGAWTQSDMDKWSARNNPTRNEGDTVLNSGSRSVVVNTTAPTVNIWSDAAREASAAARKRGSMRNHLDARHAHEVASSQAYMVGDKEGEERHKVQAAIHDAEIVKLTESKSVSSVSPGAIAAGKYKARPGNTLRSFTDTLPKQPSTFWNKK